MVTTRGQAQRIEQDEATARIHAAADLPDNLSRLPAPQNSSLKPPASSDDEDNRKDDGPPAKKVKIEAPNGEIEALDATQVRQTGATERGYVYFFFRPRVETFQPSSVDDVKNVHMLLVPRPPKFSVTTTKSTKRTKAVVVDEMDVLERGEDAVPAPQDSGPKAKHYRLITLGKKALPDPDGNARRGKRKETFWARVTAVGDDLDELEEGLGEKTYETKTRGTRHDPPARLVARGCYALVTNEATKPSDEKAYLGYTISHPSPEELASGELHVQNELNIRPEGAFLLQAKNPSVDTPGPELPEDIMKDVFGRGRRGRASQGLKFAPSVQPRVLDYPGLELLLIAVGHLEEKLGDGRGQGGSVLEQSSIDTEKQSMSAMKRVAEEEEDLGVLDIFHELWATSEPDIPSVLNGEWI
ncbi:hypothetical protein MIND_01378000 [Mycena indigotica]|uniref:Uncharacterized protein n=1 Tax=Mycena indigotica TaxID=2126181 RepID=A0A8H6VPR7_9AGAR|nr:uncharacterized protein MIND_01378000 [Mycena indigotica]KAF7289169.1 hypothetical protein MIND_01378000 [Mycena indigotica]